MAAQGVRDIGFGKVKIEDKNLADKIRLKAKSILNKSLITALILTIIILLIPA